MRKFNRYLTLGFLICSSWIYAQDAGLNYPTYQTGNYRVYEVEQALFSEHPELECFEPAPCKPSCNPKIYLEGNYTTGRYISLKEDYSGLRLFIEAPASISLRPYLDLNGYRFNNGRWAASGGLGFVADLGCNYCGVVNAFYDYRQACLGPFHQVGVGLAVGNSCWALRFNGYYPLKNTRSSTTERFDFGDGFTAQCTHKEYAYRGVDGELEFTLLKSCNFDSYLGLGGYYYKHEKANEFGGGQARFGISFYDSLTLECHASYDKIYHARVQGIFSIAIPLDSIFCHCNPCCSTPCCDLAHAYRRNNIIELNDCCQWDWNWRD